MSSKFLDKSYLIKYSNYFKVENRVFSFRNKELFDVTNTPMLLELKNNNGSKGYWKAIGIRVDEIDRMNENRVKKKILYPLVKEFPTKKIEILNNRRIMGVYTTADEIKNTLEGKTFKIITSLKELRDSMEVVINKETWGGNEWSDEFRKGVEDDIDSISKIISKLGKIKRKY